MTGQERTLLRRLSRDAAGADLGREMGISVSRAMERPARAAPRGTPAFGIDAARFVIFLQNHDQVGNSPQGLRCHELTSPGRHRALTTLLCLAPGTPLVVSRAGIFGVGSVFVFCRSRRRAERVGPGRPAQRIAAIFAAWPGSDTAGLLADPGGAGNVRAVASSNFPSGRRTSTVLALHRDLFRLRREDPVFAAQRADRIGGAVHRARSVAAAIFWRGAGGRSPAAGQSRPRSGLASGGRAAAGSARRLPMANPLVERRSTLRRIGDRAARSLLVVRAGPRRPGADRHAFLTRMRHHIVMAKQARRAPAAMEADHDRRSALVQGRGHLSVARPRVLTTATATASAIFAA